jgi:hypothetical protein
MATAWTQPVAQPSSRRVLATSSLSREPEIMPPGTIPSVNFNTLGSSLLLSSAGQVAFVASLTGSSVDSINDSGVWATDRTGALQLVVRESDQVEVMPSDFRTIEFFTFVSNTWNSDGRPSAFTNRGQFVLMVTGLVTEHSRSTLRSSDVPRCRGACSRQNVERSLKCQELNPAFTWNASKTAR